ncbi:hypothetical protein FB451DRAFT_1375623 [Mycena latifolia]|nr:hypothetical protein FB451DRAFT_1375623 [Mycena latifolia]
MPHARRKRGRKRGAGHIYITLDERDTQNGISPHGVGRDREKPRAESEKDEDSANRWCLKQCSQQAEGSILQPYETHLRGLRGAIVNGVRPRLTLASRSHCASSRSESSSESASKSASYAEYWDRARPPSSSPPPSAEERRAPLDAGVHHQRAHYDSPRGAGEARPARYSRPWSTAEDRSTVTRSSAARCATLRGRGRRHVSVGGTGFRQKPTDTGGCAERLPSEAEILKCSNIARFSAR